MALPSVKQMKVRALPVHRMILEAVRDGEKVGWVGSSIGEIRGYRTAISTLYRWHCIADEGITERGLELLEVV